MINEGEETPFPPWVINTLLPETYLVSVTVDVDAYRAAGVGVPGSEASRFQVSEGDRLYDLMCDLDLGGTIIHPGHGVTIGATVTTPLAQVMVVAGSLYAVAEAWRDDVALVEANVQRIRYTWPEARDIIAERWELPADVVCAEVQQRGPDAELPDNFDYLIRA